MNMTFFIVRAMRLDWKWIRAAGAVVLVVFGAGCSGINASKSVSPLDFLLPGIGGFLGEARPAPAPDLFPSPLPAQKTIQVVAEAN